MNSYKSLSTKTRDITLIFVLLIISGNPAFTYQTWTAAGYIAVALCLGFVFRKQLNMAFYNHFFVITYGFIAIFILQYFNLEYQSLIFILGFAIKIYSGAVIYTIVGQRFASLYFDVIYYICLLSFPFYIIHFFGGEQLFSSFYLESQLPSIGVYTFRPQVIMETYLRNSGMFWEPGAFQAFINLCFFLNFYRALELFKTRKIALLVMLIALLTTQSTTGYFVFGVVVLIYLLFYFNISRAVKVFAITGFCSVGFVVYQNLDFLSDKVAFQYEQTSDLDGEYDPSRLGSFYFDLHYIKKNPLTGNGFHPITKFADHPDLRALEEKGEELGHGNGLSGFIASAGFLGIGWYILMIGTSVSIHKFKNKFFLVLLILILLLGEHFLDLPFFLGISFLKLKFNNNNELSSSSDDMLQQKRNYA